MIEQTKALWTRFWTRRVKFNGRYRDLDRLYAIEDPWKLSHPREAYRFEQSNALIRSIVPNCEHLLELGCGEGFQTRRLVEVTKRLSGLDVSVRAVARAKQHLPDVDLRVGQAEQVSQLFGGQRFDIATAFEVLYYSGNIEGVLHSLGELTDRILVTNYEARAEMMTPYFRGPGWQRLDDIIFEDTIWQCHLWTRPPAF